MIAMPQQEMVPFGQLVPADYNPREISDEELGKLQAGLREFGLVQPIVARREDNLVIGGHQRMTALKKLLWTDGQTEEQVAGLLVPVISEAPELLPLTGFDPGQLDDILALMGNLPQRPPPVVDVEGELARQARRFSFDVETDAEAAICIDALKKFGMTGPGDADKAFAVAMHAAVAQFEKLKGAG